MSWSSCAYLPSQPCAYLPSFLFSLVILRIFTITQKKSAHIYHHLCAYLPSPLRIFTITSAHIYHHNRSYPQGLTWGFTHFPWSLITINCRTISSRGKPTSQR